MAIKLWKTLPLISWDMEQGNLQICLSSCTYICCTKIIHYSYYYLAQWHHFHFRMNRKYRGNFNRDACQIFYGFLSYKILEEDLMFEQREVVKLLFKFSKNIIQTINRLLTEYRDSAMQKRSVYIQVDQFVAEGVRVNRKL